MKNPDRQPRSGTEHRPRFAHRCSSRPSSPNARLSQYTHTQVASVRRIYYLQLGGSMIHLGYMAAYNAPARLMRGVEAKEIRNCSSPPSSNHRDRPGCQSLELVLQLPPASRNNSRMSPSTRPAIAQNASSARPLGAEAIGESNSLDGDGGVVGPSWVTAEVLPASGDIEDKITVCSERGQGCRITPSPLCPGSTTRSKV